MIRSLSGVLLAVLLTPASVAGAQPASGPEPPATLRLDDDFVYQIVDYGLGAVLCEGRPKPVDGVFWIRMKLTNAAEHLLARPKYLESAAVTDNWGNRYAQTSVCLTSKRDRYQPGESAAEILTVAARELVSDLPELRATLGPSGASVDYARGVFTIRDPRQRRRDLRRGQADADPRELQVSVAKGGAGASPADRSEAVTGPRTGTPPRPPAPPGVYRIGDTGVTPPRALREVRANYTTDAMRAKVSGTVALDLLVRPDGTVGEVQVVRSLDSTFGLDQEAIKAAKQWRFSPGTKDGEPVPVVVTIEMMFSLR